jgi:transcriptional regulator of acetoin/glycerol metabolism
VLGQPINTAGDRHFKQALQPWSFCSTPVFDNHGRLFRPWLSNTGVEQKLHGCRACLKCRSPAVLIGCPCIILSRCGEPQTLAQLADLGFRDGSYCAESIIGTCAVLIGCPCIAASDSAQVPIMLSAQ